MLGGHEVGEMKSGISFASRLIYYCIASCKYDVNGSKGKRTTAIVYAVLRFGGYLDVLGCCDLVVRERIASRR